MANLGHFHTQWISQIRKNYKLWLVLICYQENEKSNYDSKTDSYGLQIFNDKHLDQWEQNWFILAIVHETINSQKYWCRNILS